MSSQVTVGTSTTVSRRAEGFVLFIANCRGNERKGGRDGRMDRGRREGGREGEEEGEKEKGGRKKEEGEVFCRTIHTCSIECSIL